MKLRPQFFCVHLLRRSLDLVRRISYRILIIFGLKYFLIYRIFGLNRIFQVGIIREDFVTLGTRAVIQAAFVVQGRMLPRNKTVESLRELRLTILVPEHVVGQTQVRLFGLLPCLTLLNLLVQIPRVFVQSLKVYVLAPVDTVWVDRLLFQGVAVGVIYLT